MGLRALLQGSIDIDLHEAGSIEELRLAANKRKIDVIFGEFNYPGAFTKDSISAIKEAFPDVKILLMAKATHHDAVVELLKLGVDGYISTECEEDEIISAIYLLTKGERFFCKEVINVMFQKSVHPEVKEESSGCILSSREQEIVSLIAIGNTNKDIAKTLNLSVHTIHTHRRNITKKLRVNSISGIVMYAINTCLIAHPKSAL